MKTVTNLANDPQGEGESAQAADAGVARLHVLNDRLALYEKIDWKVLRAKDPTDAQEFWQGFMQTGAARDALFKKLQQDRRDQASEAQRDQARRIEDGHAALAVENADWTPELFGRVKEFGAREFGFTPEEIAAVDDPRMLKVLYRVFSGDRSASPEGESPPPPTRRGARAESALNDQQQIAEWMRQRNDQLCKPKR
jgi:hypothetical protein